MLPDACTSRAISREVVRAQELRREFEKSPSKKPQANAFRTNEATNTQLQAVRGKPLFFRSADYKPEDCDLGVSTHTYDWCNARRKNTHYHGWCRARENVLNCRRTLPGSAACRRKADHSASCGSPALADVLPLTRRSFSRMARLPSRTASMCSRVRSLFGNAADGLPSLFLL